MLEKFTIYQRPNSRGDKYNPTGFTKKYEIERENITTLAKAVEYDNCPALYEDGYKKGDKFIQADCILADIDNNHSDEETEWVVHDDVITALPTVEFYYYPSRNHMKEKDTRAPRPKEHYIFPTDTLKSIEEYTNTMKTLIEMFPQLHFDKAVQGKAQLNFGVENPKVSYHKGTQNLSEFLRTLCPMTQNESSSQKNTPMDIIPQGQRHNYMLSFANRILTRYGDNEKTYKTYIKETSKCSPPLQEKEITTIWNDSVNYYHTTIKTAPNYVAPEQYKKALSQQQTYKPKMFSDLGQAIVFSKLHQGKLRYSTATKYLFYNGKIWEESDIKAQSLAQDLTRYQLDEAWEELKQAHEMENDSLRNANKEAEEKAKEAIKQAEQYRKFALHRQNTLQISATLKEARPMLEIDTKLLDKDWFKLNTPNGTIDLRTRELQPHNFEDYCTKITTKSPSDEGAEFFSNFLNVITCGDKELEEYLQCIAGMIAIGKVFCEHLLIAYGCGRNGKSTFFNLLARVLGSYSGSLSSEVLTANCRKNKSPEYAELRGKRLAIAAELEDDMRLDTAIVKKLCSTDPIQAEKKYKAPFHYIPSHTVVLYTNHLPNVSALDDGTWRRLIVIPFNARITDSKDRKDYAEYLFENAGGAVMKWIVEGAYKFISSDYKLQQPEVVTDAVNLYRAENDWISNYISERCDVDRTFKQSSGTLYEDYRKFCKNNGEFPKSNATFNKALEEKGYHKKKISSGNFIHGLRLRYESTVLEIPTISFSNMTVDDGELQEIPKLVF